MSKEALDILQQSAPIFAMLQDENRQQILLMLCQTGPQSVKQITDKMKLSRPAVSHHLKLLLDQNLVSVKKNGTERKYAVTLQPAIVLLKQLTQALEDQL
ncbi:ArsR/SmtB family transcription factor [Periweissella beninensis]|uniref:Helix-turn-helix transcriptional regulator n=1 Tax=Periweissella beninensis TaxID=504936 RepID=A0ABT0VFX9_9LACO|nr:metalloregulator ArsR/SmtB family transcription factor [Periweissella beninensis]MBM7543876.1 DNA-binding transcriptional ArsR family regulator [Periweissella beninensis]MCM2436743.1 helix-turn-helix transcriptional regulator [Periweissella beninensis]MCT4395545.1 transcriptional regulator [Periweissella beninensis]